MQCKNCNHIMAAGATFCSQCGHEVEPQPTAAAPAPTPSQPAAEPVTGTPPPTLHMQTTRAPSSFWTSLSILGFGLSLLAGVTVATRITILAANSPWSLDSTAEPVITKSYDKETGREHLLTTIRISEAADVDLIDGGRLTATVTEMIEKPALDASAAPVPAGSYLTTIRVAVHNSGNKAVTDDFARDFYLMDTTMTATTPTELAISGCPPFQFGKRTLEPGGMTAGCISFVVKANSAFDSFAFVPYTQKGENGVRWLPLTGRRP